MPEQEEVDWDWSDVEKEPKLENLSLIESHFPTLARFGRILGWCFSAIVVLWLVGVTVGMLTLFVSFGVSICRSLFLASIETMDWIPWALGALLAILLQGTVCLLVIYGIVRLVRLYRPRKKQLNKGASH